MIENNRGTSVGEQDTERTDLFMSGRRNVTSRDVITAGVVVFCLVSTAIFCEIVLHISAQRVFAALGPIVSVVGILQMYRKRKRTKRNTEAGVVETAKPYRPIEP
jgi:hypothetical protein